jgi:hypothetical protein
MSRILIMLVVAAWFGCSQHNPAVCCNTPTQCTSFGLDGIIGCDPGKVCDPTGACISPQCASSAECADPTPYCSSAGLCDMTCVADTECPGGGQATNQVHCVGGACVECGQASDCPANAPICANAMCRACTLDADCPSEACGADGTCVAVGDIAYVDPGGADTADCSQATPCSLVHGVSIGRTYTVLAPGSYEASQTLGISGTRWFIGVGALKPSITRTSAGPIITVGVASDLHFSNLQLTGATNTNSTSFDGVGIECANDMNPRSLELDDVVVTANAATGVDGNTCSVTANRSAFTHNGGLMVNGGAGLYVRDHPVTIDRCEFSRNSGDGFLYDGTVALITNSFFTGNLGTGVSLSSGDVGGHIQFCTVASNGMVGVYSEQQPVDISNDLIANNDTAGIQCTSGSCPSMGSIVLGSDISTAHFKSLLDWHITAGSVAIDAASGSTNDHDFDGDVRPLGNGRDVGADEAQ